MKKKLSGFKVADRKGMRFIRCDLCKEDLPGDYVFYAAIYKRHGASHLQYVKNFAKDLCKKCLNTKLTLDLNREAK